MTKVRLNRDWKTHSEGDVLTEEDRPEYTLNFLLRQGWGEEVTPPTKDDTVEEIKAYMDAEGIEYSHDDRKQELLDKCYGLFDE